VIDVGARLGDWSKEAKSVWPDADFILIEANLECEPALREAGSPYILISLLSDHHREVTFFTMRDCATATGCSYYRENTPFFEGDKAVEHKRWATTLDLALGPFTTGLPILLKIDTQGSELDIMRGGLKTLGQADAVVLEVAHTNYNEGAPPAAEVDSFMYEHGFHLAEKLGDIVHPISRELIQEDVLYLR
jgi:FkbM family methyltransferase